jgi:hypothetical protein
LKAGETIGSTRTGVFIAGPNRIGLILPLQ